MKPQTYANFGPFTADYQEYVRRITNPNGRGNAAFDPEEERKMPPQDELVGRRITLNGICGIAQEFLWKSGRQDVHIHLDMPKESFSPEARRKWRDQMKTIAKDLAENRVNRRAKLTNLWRKQHDQAA